MVTPRTPELAEALATIKRQAATIKRQAATIKQQAATITQQGSVIAKLEQRIAELERRLEEKDKPGPPSFVKPNRPRKTEGEKKPREKRTENHARKLEAPTEEVIHAVEACPGCGRELVGGWEHDRRQVIDIPRTPYIVRDHVRLRRWCGVCGKAHLPELDLTGEVVGKHRVSVRVMGLVAYLRIEHRMPYAGIRQFLEAHYGLRLSEGEIIGLCQKVADLGREAYDALLEELRSSAVVHADETGWREDGRNGYLWVFLTSGIQIFHRDASRGSAVPREMLGEEFTGIVVADFYSGYSPLECEKQRCWVHFLRDLKQLEETHPKHAGVAKWRAQIQSVYAQAAAYRTEQRAYDGALTMRLRNARAKKRRDFERALMKLARPHLKNKDDPRYTLAKRIERFRHELFVFVEHPDVPPENNAAERGLRPSVIARKISGGTRSARGSETMAILRSLFGTWQLQGKKPLEACLDLIASAPA